MCSLVETDVDNSVNSDANSSLPCLMKDRDSLFGSATLGFLRKSFSRIFPITDGKRRSTCTASFADMDESLAIELTQLN